MCYTVLTKITIFQKLQVLEIISTRESNPLEAEKDLVATLSAFMRKHSKLSLAAAKQADLKFHKGEEIIIVVINHLNMFCGFKPNISSVVLILVRTPSVNLSKNKTKQNKKNVILILDCMHN